MHLRKFGVNKYSQSLRERFRRRRCESRQQTLRARDERAVKICPSAPQPGSRRRRARRYCFGVVEFQAGHNIGVLVGYVTEFLPAESERKGMVYRVDSLVPRTSLPRREHIREFVFGSRPLEAQNLIGVLSAVEHVEVFLIEGHP